MYSAILPIVLILMVYWSAVWIDPREIESRLTITIVCLLSLISIICNRPDMPKLEYLTIMDYNFNFLCITQLYQTLSIYSFH